MLLEQSVDLHPSSVAEHATYLPFEELLGTVAVDSKGFERYACWIFTSSHELCGHGVRNVEGHPHGFNNSTVGGSVWGSGPYRFRLGF